MTGIHKDFERVLQCMSFIDCYLESSSSCEQRALLESAGEKRIKAILECILNVLSGNVKIKDEVHKEMLLKKHMFLPLAFDKRLGWQKKKKFLIANHKQTGGILGEILDASANFLWDHLFGKKKDSEQPPEREPETGLQ